MRRADREIADFGAIVELVGRCDTLRLGLADGGEAYVVPVSFGYEAQGGELAFYFHGARAGRKWELLARNPRVCVEGDLCHGFVDNGHGGVTCDFESFVGYGEAALLSGEEARRGLRLLLEHCGTPEYRCGPEAAAATVCIGLTDRPWPKLMVMALISRQGLGTSGQPISGSSSGAGRKKPTFCMKDCCAGMPAVSAMRTEPTLEECWKISGTVSQRCLPW